MYEFLKILAYLRCKDASVFELKYVYESLGSASTTQFYYEIRHRYSTAAHVKKIITKRGTLKCM